MHAEVVTCPDVCGWGVLLATEHTIGIINDLMVDPTTMAVVYLVIAVDAENAGRKRQVLAPAACCRLDVANQVVVLSGMTSQQLATLPESDGVGPPARYDELYRSRLSNAYPPRRTTRPASELEVRRHVVGDDRTKEA